jgi:hypothetical protein
MEEVGDAEIVVHPLLLLLGRAKREGWNALTVTPQP